MTSSRSIPLSAAVPCGALCIIVGTLFVLRGMGGASIWTSNPVAETVVGFLLVAVGGTVLWLGGHPQKAGVSHRPGELNDSANQEGMRRLREAFGTSWSEPQDGHAKPAARVLER